MPLPNNRVTGRRDARIAFSPTRIETDWRVLCEDIGVRLAGTAAERRAADFIARRMRESGCENVRLEEFPCASLRRASTELYERSGRGWRRVEAAALVGAPGTPGGRPVSGDLVWLEMPEGAARLQPGSLRGRILALFGPMPTAIELHRRLVASEPLAVIHVDDRLPFSWTKNDGVYPHWALHAGMPPTISAPYMDAWRWRRDGVRRLKLRIAIDQPQASSVNVVAELPGTEPALPALVLTAHHDTQCGNPGADDNASGVVTLLALAPLLARSPRRRTVRIISFGAEEQLSVGAMAYVRRHRVKITDTGLVLNFDSVSSPLGHFAISVAGSEALARFGVRQLAQHGLDAAVCREVTPFSDHFPFNLAGVPSLWFRRTNFAGGRWQHHSRHDTLENVSAAEVCRLLRAVAPMMLTLASRAKWPPSVSLPLAARTAARRLGRELFGENGRG